MALEDAARESQECWYLIARSGDLLLRLGHELHIGEDESGELLLRPAPTEALVVIAVKAGELTLRRANDTCSLRDDDGSDCEHIVLEPGACVLLALPNNTFTLTGDSLKQGPVTRRLRVEPVPSTHPGVGELPPASEEIVLAEPAVERHDVVGDADIDEPEIPTLEVPVAAAVEQTDTDLADRACAEDAELPGDEPEREEVLAAVDIGAVVVVPEAAAEEASAEEASVEAAAAAETAAVEEVAAEAETAEATAETVSAQRDALPVVVLAAPSPRRGRQSLAAEQSRPSSYRPKRAVLGILIVALAGLLYLNAERDGEETARGPADTIDYPDDKSLRLLSSSASRLTGEAEAAAAGPSAPTAAGARPVPAIAPVLQADEPPIPDPEADADAQTSSAAADTSPPSPPPPSQGAPARTDAPAIERRLAEQLSEAQRLIDAGVLIDLGEQNAVKTLVAVLEQDPTNEQALQMIYQCATLLLAQAQAADAEGDEFLARNLTEEVLAFHPTLPEALELRKSLWALERGDN